MTDRCVIHDTFSIERTYPAAPSRVFAAFASVEAKEAWGDTGGLEPANGEARIEEFDFRPGGRERLSHTLRGRTLRYDALYYDIVPNRRIVYSYEMYADDARISVSVATIEFAASGDGTTLTWTEQGAYLDGSLWRSLMRLDLIDEFHVSMYPYVADEGTQMFGDVPKSYRLDLISSTAKSNGILELQYRRHR